MPSCSNAEQHRSWNRSKTHACTHRQSLTSKPQFLPNICILPQYKKRNSEIVIPMFILANTRTQRYTALLTAERTDRKPNTATAKQFDQHLQWWGQGSGWQCLTPIPRLYVLRSCSLRPEPQFFQKRRLPPRWRCLSHTSTHFHSPVPLANCHCYTKNQWSLCQEDRGKFKDRLMDSPIQIMTTAVSKGCHPWQIHLKYFYFKLNYLYLSLQIRDVCIKGWNASYSCPAQKQVESCFPKTVQSFDTDCYNHKDSRKRLNRKSLLEQ